jgi:hypothetical protein
MVRNPLDVIPSYISTLELHRRALAASVMPWSSRDYVLDMAGHWYTYPLECLKDEPEDRYLFVRFDDLVRDPEQTVREIYRRLQLDMGSEFAGVLRAEAERSHGYRSAHHYSLDQVGLTRERVIAEYRHVFDRFGFDTREQAG